MNKKKSPLGIVSASNRNPSRQFKQALQQLRSHDGYLGCSESNAFFHTLASMIDHLSNSEVEPHEGIELLLDFFRTDAHVFNSCDDSNGTVGNVYTIDACDLFVQYAAAYNDKRWIADSVVDLYRKDDFGVRYELVHRAKEYLPVDILSSMSETFWREVDLQNTEYGKRHYLMAIETIARQSNNPSLFEKAALARMGKQVNSATYVTIAQAYLEASDALTALSWLKKIPEGTNFYGDKRDNTMFAVYAKLGMKKEQSIVAWRIFRRSRCPETLNLLLSVIGEHELSRVVEEEIKLLLAMTEMKLHDVQFILHMGYVSKAEELVLSHAHQLDESQYYSILPLIDIFEENERYLTTSILYRSLVDSILERGISKYYHHAVRYMKHLNRLEPLVEHWRGFQSHDEYTGNLFELHARKSSFWDKMGTGKTIAKPLKRRIGDW